MEERRVNERDESRWPSRWGAGQETVRLPSLSATVLPENEEWRRDAACGGEETDLFFPVGSGPDALEQTDEAKAVCARCPVSTDCLSFALDTDQSDGVWGGLSEDERRAVKRKQARAAT
jgi:WhiB family redox-sensing transcriptional regulator